MSVFHNHLGEIRPDVWGECSICEMPIIGEAEWDARHTTGPDGLTEAHQECCLTEGDCSPRNQPKEETMATPTSPHEGHDVTARCDVQETFRTDWEDGVLHIVKNEEYEVVCLDFFCNDCCETFETDDVDHEWSV